jgi:hypothetical protein
MMRLGEELPVTSLDDQMGMSDDATPPNPKQNDAMTQPSGTGADPHGTGADPHGTGTDPHGTGPPMTPPAKPSLLDKIKAMLKLKK